MNTIQQQAAQAIRQMQADLAEAAVTRQYALQPEVWLPYGEIGRQHSVRDEGYLLTYLCEALAAGEPALFIEYLAWARVFFAGLKFREDMLPMTLATTRQTLEQMLPAECKPAALEYLDMGLHSLVEAPAALESFIEHDNPLAGLARRYLDSLLRGDRPSASRMILDSAGSGTPIPDIYMHVFQPSQREIGRLWQTNQISVAQEHYCTAATQMIMSQLYPYIFASERKGRRLVVACVGGELHEIGARMVADIFEMDGWDTYFLGANTPMESVLRTLAEREPDVLAVSATMTFHIDKVSRLIDALRQAGLDRRTRVLAGGYPFNIAPGLWKTVKADGFASDARQALSVAESLIK